MDITVENNSLRDETMGTTDLGVIVGDDEILGSTPTKTYPPGTAVKDRYEIQSLPDAFDLDSAMLYSGAANLRRATVGLAESGKVTTAQPLDFPVSGTLTMAYGGTFAVAAAQLIPFDCSDTFSNPEGATTR